MVAEVVGQDHLLRPDAPIGRMVANRKLSSMILWGPPGCGKTTIARLLAQGTDLVFEPLSAVFSGVADLRFNHHTRRSKVGDRAIWAGECLLFPARSALGGQRLHQTSSAAAPQSLLAVPHLLHPLPPVPAHRHLVEEAAARAPSVRCMFWRVME